MSTTQDLQAPRARQAKFSAPARPLARTRPRPRINRCTTGMHSDPPSPALRPGQCQSPGLACPETRTSPQPGNDDSESAPRLRLTGAVSGLKQPLSRSEENAPDVDIAPRAGLAKTPFPNNGHR